MAYSTTSAALDPLAHCLIAVYGLLIWRTRWELFNEEIQQSLLNTVKHIDKNEARWQLHSRDFYKVNLLPLPDAGLMALLPTQLLFTHKIG